VKGLDGFIEDRGGVQLGGIRVAGLAKGPARSFEIRASPFFSITAPRPYNVSRKIDEIILTADGATARLAGATALEVIL
jgi:hypothetical protein